MRILLTVLLASFAGAAAAGDIADSRGHDSNDYAGQVYYRLDFGGVRQHAQSVGLRFDQERAAAQGRPALFQASFGEQGMDRLAVNGLDLRGAMLAANQAEGGFFSNLSTGQWVGIGFTALVFAAIVVEASDSDDPEGTGSSGSGY